MVPKHLFGKRKAAKQTISNVTSDDDSKGDAFEVIESLVTDLDDSASDEELVEGYFVVASIRGAKGVFLRKIPGHRPS